MSEKPITVNNYFNFMKEKKLMATECLDCGSIELPARAVCSKCQSSNMKWKELSGKGKLATFTTVHVGAEVMAKKGYNMKKPYCFAIMEIDEKEKVYVSGQLIGVDETKPENIPLGMPLRSIFLTTEDGVDKEGKPYLRYDVGFEPLK